MPASTYPDDAAERDRWILARRGPRQTVQVDRPYAFLVEQERFATGEVGSVATIFLTNRECPWRCVMCDLWRHTTRETVPLGAIPQQIAYALTRLPATRQIKLYNSGSFFDAHSIPAEDHEAIAHLVRGFERVIVECHPSLVGDRCARFQELLGTQLEVALGLETAHPAALEKLNKRMTVEHFAVAAGWLLANGIDLRTFLLIHPPFVPAGDAQAWARLSIDVALQCGATATTLIPVRGDTGALKVLAGQGTYASPTLHALEEALCYGIQRGAEIVETTQLRQPRVFADLWGIDRVAGCEECGPTRVERLRRINDTQHASEPVHCSRCNGLS